MFRGLPRIASFNAGRHGISRCKGGAELLRQVGTAKAEENNLVAQYAKEILSGANMVFALTEAMFTMIHSLHLSGRRRMQSKKITLGSAW